ncbi:MAG: hypothetical protein ACREE0_07150 [Phenylobacterium sp.]
MPGINLEALNTGDLRRLLKVAHDRHDGPLADRLEWEIAARATGAARGAHPFATPSDEEPEEPGFRMTATDDAPIVPGAAARRDPEIRTFAREAPEPDAWRPEAPQAPEAPERIAEPPAARIPEAQAPERSRWLSIGLAALAGCLLTAAVFLAGALTGERTALKRSAQAAALAPGAASLTVWPDPTQTAPSLAPLDQAFSGPASPPGAEARPLAVTQAAPKKVKKRGARTWEAYRPTRLDTWSKGSEQEEPIY